MKRTKAELPEHLYAAYDWISAAGEWSEAKEEPEKYAREAAENAVAHKQYDVTESDLLEVIEWSRRHEI